VKRLATEQKTWLTHIYLKNDSHQEYIRIPGNLRKKRHQSRNMARLIQIVHRKGCHVRNKDNKGCLTSLVIRKVKIKFSR
jgi:4-hydroxy-3-methylbut-2-en-1-yl diphosphate synthase IspG/GcpE